MPKENGQIMSMAITHEPVYALSEILALKTVPVLKKMASGFRVKGCSGMNKSELVNSVAAMLPDEKEMADNLTLISDDEWVIFQKTAVVTEVIEDCSSDAIPFLLLGIGYLAAFQHNGKTHYVIPDEIKVTFNKLMQSGYGDEWTYITTLNKYARAATALYGIITLDDFATIFNSQNERKTSIEDVCNLLLRFIATDEGYCFWGEYIVMDGFEENDFKDVEDLAKSAASKPRYLPPREKLLRYADDSYFELTPQMITLKDYIVKRLHVKDSADVYTMLAEIHCLCSQEADMQPIMDVFNRRGINLNNKEQVNELMRHVMGVMNNTRLWLNNGHTPDELYEKIEKPHMKPLPSQSEQSKNEPRRSTKVGRNEPCPCGSGKKYKKCCGW